MNKIESLSPTLEESEVEPGSSPNTTRHADGSIRSNAKRLRQSLFSLGRNLLTVDDSTLDLPFRQFRVCLALYGRTASMSAIGRELGLSLSSMTQIADRLDRVGLVERVSAGSDRRVRNLKLTEKGECLMRSHEESQLQRITESLQSLSSEQTEEVLRTLDILIHASGSQQEVEPHR